MKWGPIPYRLVVKRICFISAYPLLSACFLFGFSPSLLGIISLPTTWTALLRSVRFTSVHPELCCSIEANWQDIQADHWSGEGALLPATYCNCIMFHLKQLSAERRINGGICGRTPQVIRALSIWGVLRWWAARLISVWCPRWETPVMLASTAQPEVPKSIWAVPGPRASWRDHTGATVRIEAQPEDG